MASEGRITQVKGPVVDVEFAARRPARSSTWRSAPPTRRSTRARTTSCSRSRSTSARTPCAPSPWTRPTASCAARRCVSTGDGIRVPVGPKTLGRIMNVIGEPVDERGPIGAEKSLPDPPPRPGVRRPGDHGRGLRDRHQGRRPDRALSEGRQDRPVRRRRRRQDRRDPGADQQHRQAARRLLGVRRRRRAHPRGQRPLARDGRLEARRRHHRARQGGAGLRPDERAAGRPRPRRPLGAHRGRVLPRRRGQGRAALHRQHLPLHPGGLRGVGAARPHPVGGRLPADALDRDGRAPGAHHLDEQGLDHLGAGDLRARRRPHRPGARHRVRAPRRDHGALARRSPSSASTPPSIRSTRPAAILDPQVVGEEHYDVARGVQQMLQKYKDLQDIIAILGMDELSRGRQAHRGARAQDPEASCRSRSTSPSSSPARPAPTCASRTRSAASRRSSKASTTTCPSRRSTWSAPSRTPSPRRRRWSRAGRACLELTIVTPEGQALPRRRSRASCCPAPRATSACSRATSASSRRCASASSSSTAAGQKRLAAVSRRLRRGPRRQGRA